MIRTTMKIVVLECYLINRFTLLTSAVRHRSLSVGTVDSRRLVFLLIVALEHLNTGLDLEAAMTCAEYLLC